MWLWVHDEDTEDGLFCVQAEAVPIADGTLERGGQEYKVERVIFRCDDEVSRTSGYLSTDGYYPYNEDVPITVAHIQVFVSEVPKRR